MDTGRTVTQTDCSRYGDFTLTDAIRPASCMAVIPREGYRIQVYRDRRVNLRMPMLTAAVSKERLFDTFLALMEPLGSSLHVVLESSHDCAIGYSTEYRRNGVDKPVLLSHFCEYEDLLMNDGCTGIAVMSRKRFVEVQFDEHKLLHVYAADLKPYRRRLKAMGIRRRELMPLVSEGEHLHHTTDDYAEKFRQLCSWVGIENYESAMSDEAE